MPDYSIVDYEPQCSLCIHFNAADRAKDTCKAFPDGIPREILVNEFDHRKAWPGDHGVRFEERR